MDCLGLLSGINPSLKLFGFVSTFEEAVGLGTGSRAYQLLDATRAVVRHPVRASGMPKLDITVRAVSLSFY